MSQLYHLNKMMCDMWYDVTVTIFVSFWPAFQNMPEVSELSQHIKFKASSTNWDVPLFDLLAGVICGGHYRFHLIELARKFTLVLTFFGLLRNGYCRISKKTKNKISQHSSTKVLHPPIWLYSWIRTSLKQFQQNLNLRNFYFIYFICKSTMDNIKHMIYCSRVSLKLIFICNFMQVAFISGLWECTALILARYTQ